MLRFFFSWQNVWVLYQTINNRRPYSNNTKRHDGIGLDFALKVLRMHGERLSPLATYHPSTATDVSSTVSQSSRRQIYHSINSFIKHARPWTRSHSVKRHTKRCDVTVLMPSLRPLPIATINSNLAEKHLILKLTSLWRRRHSFSSTDICRVPMLIANSEVTKACGR